jgi:hypothetical protein
MYDDVNCWLNSCTNMSRSPFSNQNDPLLFDSYDHPGQSSLFAPTPEYAPTPGYGICQTPSVMTLISPEDRLDDEFSPQSRSPQTNQIQLLQLGEWEEGRLYDELPPTCYSLFDCVEDGPQQQQIYLEKHSARPGAGSTVSLASFFRA